MSQLFKWKIYKIAFQKFGRPKQVVFWTSADNLTLALNSFGYRLY